MLFISLQLEKQGYRTMNLWILLLLNIILKCQSFHFEKRMNGVHLILWIIILRTDSLKGGKHTPKTDEKNKIKNI